MNLKMKHLELNLKTAFASIFAATLFISSPTMNAQTGVMTESGLQVANTNPKKDCAKPRDGFYDRYLHTEKRVLPYDYIHEKDVFWEKRIWREIDTREKMNHAFTSQHGPFIQVLMNAAQAGDITLYDTWNDQFTQALTQEEIRNLLISSDTISIYDPVTFMDSIVVVENELNWENIQKYRIKEVWYFDEETSSMGVRILGIAPIINRYDDQGNFLNQGPMFWAYYPEMRETLAKAETFNPMNDAVRLSWDDLFEARMFSSYIIKENNVHDRRIQDYAHGTNALLEGERIHDEIFNFEHDLWSY